jgi:L-ascorbate metabolism protein UlaG (beta-lactamase superfamily)
MARIRWLGHPAVEVITAVDEHIFFDPWITGNPVCPIKLEDVKKADVVCVTHGHPDHIGDALEIVKLTGAKLICSPEIGFYADKKGLKYDEASYPLDIGGSVTIGSATIHMTYSNHTSNLWEENKLIAASGSCSYVIELEEGVRIFFAGDTGLFSDMRLIGDLYNPQIAILPIDGRYNMGPKLATIAVQWIRPEVVLPIHHGTYPEMRQNLSDFELMIKERVPGIKLAALKPGESFDYP